MFDFIKNKLSYALLKEGDTTGPNFNKECPENKSSLISKFTFSWVNKLVIRGFFKAPLQMNDVYDIPDSIKVENTSKILNNIQFNKNSKGGYTLIKHIYKHFILNNKKSIITEILITIFSFTSPLCLKYFIIFLSDTNKDKSFLYGLLLCFLLFLSSFSFSTSHEMFYWFGMKTSLNVKGALSAKIFEKTLKLSNSSKRKYNSGKIMNIMAVDAENISDFFWTHCLDIFSHFIQIITLLTLLCTNVVGPSGLVGFGVMLVALPLNTYFCAKSSDNLEVSLKYSDKRCNYTSEMINIIKFLKMQSWESVFLERIEKQRKSELKYLYKTVLYWICDNMMIHSTAALVLVSTFATYTFTTGNSITLDIAFTSLNIFLNLRYAMILLPEDIYKALGLIPSCKRIEKLLQSPEIQSPTFNSKNNNSDIKIENATFQWNELNDTIFDDTDSDSDHEDDSEKDDGNDENELINSKEEKEEIIVESNVLENINFKAPLGKLTIIVGVIGSGKTSLVSGLIGEIYRKNGNVVMPSNCSFTSQQPFIISGSLRENILFGLPFEIERYKKVIEACSLTSDLLQLQALDLSDIGANGINISGGQKQRVSLARALYSNSDCFIMDEPLSAVDPHVASHLFKNCIQGMMGGKTRILITHQLQFLSSADHIVVINSDGTLTQGTYYELTSSGIDFESVIKSNKLNLKDNGRNENDDSPSDDITNTNAANTTNQENINIDLVISEKHDPSFLEKAKLLIEEDRKEGSVGFNVYKQYFLYGGSGKMVITTFVLFFFSQVVFAASDYWLAFWSEQSFGQKSNTFYFGYYCLIIGAFVVLVAIRYLLMANITFQASRNLHSSLLKSVAYASSEFFDVNPAGRILNRFSKDINDVDAHLLEVFSESILCVATFIVGIASMIYISPIIVIPFAVIVVVYYFIQNLYLSSSRELNRMESITRSPVFSLLTECYNGLTTIRSFQQQSRFISMMNNNLNINQRCFFYIFSVQRWVGIRTELLASLVVFSASFIALFSTNTGYAALSVTTALSLTGLTNWMLMMIVETQLKMNSFERIQSYIETPMEGTNIANNQIEIIDSDDDEDADNFTWSNGEIEFKNVEIKYRKGLEPSLQNISFKTNSNEKIGIVGKSGSGKSTLGQALFRMVECSKGSIYIDGIDISTISLKKLRNSISIVPQDPTLFSGSFKLNMDPFNKHTDQEIWEALDKVQLKDTISSMPLKLETVVQENGNDGLSFGQKQLFCLARTILKNSKVVLFDEYSSGIDYFTSVQLSKSIQDNFKNCTLLTIAHRLDTIIESDKIALVNKGSLLEYDTPNNLLYVNLNSKFKKLVLNSHYSENNNDNE